MKGQGPQLIFSGLLQPWLEQDLYDFGLPKPSSFGGVYDKPPKSAFDKAVDYFQILDPDEEDLNGYLRDDLDMPGFDYRDLWLAYKREAEQYQIARQHERQRYIKAQAESDVRIRGELAPWKMLVKDAMPKREIDKLHIVDIARLKGKHMGTNTIAQWMTYYDQLLIQHEATHPRHKPLKPPKQIVAQKPKSEPITSLPFKGKNKRDALIRKLELSTEQVKTLQPPPISAAFDIKKNKQYQLHAVYQPGTYIIDLMFSNNQYTYLVCINGNTRALYVEATNNIAETGKDGELVISQDEAKATAAYLQALQAIMSRCGKIKHLTGDGEKAFVSQRAKRFYESHNIDFIPVRRDAPAVPEFMPYAQGKIKRTDPNHTSLGMIDRVIKTLRDMAFQLKKELITPQLMEKLVMYYNAAPHKNLSSIMKFELTPDQVEQDPKLEREIIRRIIASNHLIKESKGFMLAVGSKVYVLNPKSTMLKRRSAVKPYIGIIRGFNGVLYDVEIPNGTVQKYSRSQLKPV